MRRGQPEQHHLLLQEPHRRPCRPVGFGVAAVELHDHVEGDLAHRLEQQVVEERIALVKFKHRSTKAARAAGNRGCARISSGGRGGTRSSRLPPGLWGRGNGSFRLRSGAVASFDSIDTSRVIAFPGFADSAKANLNGYTGQAFGEVGYGMSFGQIALEPFAGVADVRVHDAAFAENGGIAALSGSASNREHRLFLARRARRHAMDASRRHRAQSPRRTDMAARLRRRHPTAALAFQSSGSAFSVGGVPIATDSALVEGGVDWRITAQIKFGVEYQGELAQHAQVHTAKGKFTWIF